MDPRLEALLLRAEIDAFNAEYAALLDRQDLTGWTQCFTADAFYVVISRENFERGHPVGLIYCEGRPMIEDRAFALLKTSMFGPRSLRHMISNLTVAPQPDGTVQARANFVVFEVLTDRPEARVLQVGEYRDIFAREDGALRLRERRCVIGRTKQGAAAAVVGIHEAQQHRQEQLPLRRAERLQQPLLRALHGREHGAGNAFALRRDAGEDGAAIGLAALALDQAALGQAAEHVGDVGAVQPDFLRQRDLVDVRVQRQRGQHGVLHRGDLEGAAFLEKQGAMDLVQPAHEVAGAAPERQALDQLAEFRVGDGFGDGGLGGLGAGTGALAHGIIRCMGRA
jgi:anthranilate 1,2-dioxygenase small subunit